MDYSAGMALDAHGSEDWNDSLIEAGEVIATGFKPTFKPCQRVIAQRARVTR